ncbi:MAG: cupin domain-containing protein [Thermomicrobiales bacterium]
MFRLHLLIALVLTLSWLPGLARPLAAQEESLPEGVTVDIWATAVTDAVPENANQILLFRMTLAPGAGLPITPEEGSVSLVEVERGAVTTTVDAPMSVSRAGAEAGSEEAIPAGEPFTLAMGDSALYGPDLTGEFGNAGTEVASVIVLEALPTAAAEEMAFPDGITVEVLAWGETSDLPRGDVLMLIGRFSMEPAAGVPEHAHPGAELGVLEEGTVAFKTYDGPALQIARQVAEAMTSGTEPVIETAAPGEEILAEVGDAVFVPAGNVSETRNGGEGPASALLGEITVAGEDE